MTLEREVGALQARMETVESELQGIRSDVREIRDALVGARGSWKAICLVVGLSVSLGAAVAKLLPRVNQLLNRAGILSYEHDTARFADVGGLENLKNWLRQRKPAFEAKAVGNGHPLDPPKGVLLLGVQGCGKSLAARAAAGIFEMPLLRLDFAAIHSKWHGESERNLRDTLKTAELMAPCVVWVDEIEKGVATGDGDSGVSRRALGTLLTWLAEKKANVFVVATANDISALPPELIRKGRLDEITHGWRAVDAER